MTPEEELADATRPDLRIHNADVDAPVAIELKIADNWSYTELSDALRDQLVGRYMRDQRSRHGVFLLTWHGGKQRWRHRGSSRILAFDQLVVSLQEEADAIVAQDPGVDDLAVVGVDLTRRDASVPRRSSACAATVASE